MKKIGIGIIGCGQISNAYFSAAKRFDSLHLIACADLLPEAAETRAKEHSVEALSVETLLADPRIEIVVNLTIPGAHAPIALQTLAHGKHAYSEKPLAVTLEDGRQILAAAKQKNLRVGCAPDTFLGGGQQTCRKLVDDGWIGRPIGGTVMLMGAGPERYFHPSPRFFFEPGGGPLFDMGPYYLTALVNLLGPARRVCAITTKAFEERIAGLQARIPRERIPVQVPTHLAGIVEFQNGAVINMVFSFDVWKHGHNPIELYGTEGTLFVPDPNTFGGPVKVARGGTRQVEISECPLSHIYTEPSRSLGVADLAQAILTDRPHRCSGAMALHVLDIMESFETSSRTGRHVTLGTTCERPAPLPLGLLEGRVDALPGG